jgi:hypothetical protein
MTFSSLIIVLFIFLLVGLIIFRPFLDQEMTLGSAGSSRYDSLLAERERLYAAIEELDLNLELNKISKQEYTNGRNELLANAASVLKKIEEHPLSARKDPDAIPPDPDDANLERMIAERRQALKAARVDVCPSCGEAISPEDQFCSSCGERV